MTPYTRRMAVTEHWLRTPHWSTDIPLDTPHPRLDVLAEHGFVVLRDLDRRRSPSRSTSRSSTWTGRAAATPTSRPIATADGELDCRGFWKEGDERPDKGGRFTSNARVVPAASSPRSSRSAPTSAGCASIKLEPQGYDDALRQIHRDDNNRFNPDDDGWVVRAWTELTDNPDSFMILMEQGPDGLPDPTHRGAAPAAPRRALRARHAAALARRVPPRHRAALRAHLQLRERPRPRRLDRVATPLT